MIKDIYTALKEAGAELASHESDLYVKKTPETTRIIKEYEYYCNVTSFIFWYEIPFAFNPFWEARQNKTAFVKGEK